MLYFKVLAWISLDVNFRGISIDLRTVIHQELTNYMCAMQAYLDIVSIVEGQVSQGR